MVKELKELDEDTKLTVKWVSAEYKFTRALLEVIKKAEQEGAKEALKDLKSADKNLRQVGRSERKVNRDENAVIEDLNKIAEILPDNLKTEDHQLIERLKPAKAKLVALASRFAGELKDDLSKIKTYEQLRAHIHDPSKESDATKHLRILFKKTEGEIDELITWIQSTETVFKQIEDFIAKLEHLSA